MSRRIISRLTNRLLNGCLPHAAVTVVLASVVSPVGTRFALAVTVPNVPFIVALVAGPVGAVIAAWVALTAAAFVAAADG